MSDIIKIGGVRGYVDKDGMAWLNAEDVAKGFGFTDVREGKEYVRWARVNEYLNSFGFSPQVAKDDFIPENMVYRLGFKASNEVAQSFQAKLADEILPTIRKTGSYSVKQAPAIDTVKQMRAEAMLRNSRVRQAKLLQELAQSAVTDTAKQILVVQAANTVAGEKILSLPRANERATITASELCKRYHLKETWATALGRKLNERLERNEDTGYNTQTVSERTHKEVKQWNWYVDKIIPVMDKMQENGVFDGHYEG